MPKNNSLERIVAAYASRHTGKKIAEELPHISSDYKAGLSLREIVEKYDIMERYQISNKNTAVAGVSYALKLLIPKKEREKIGFEHMIKSGKLIAEKGIGIAGMSHEKCAELGRKASIARGQTPWTQEEKNYLLRLFEDPSYNYYSTSGKCYRRDIKKIKSELEKFSGIKRTETAIENMYYYELKKTK
ncbi:MAG: hypothetical protein QXU88_00835 [Candidatus Woesearchaeota archaeon]